MIKASVCTIGDEILIGQIVDTNSSHIAAALEEAGIAVTRMVSLPDKREEILGVLGNELKINDIVITTGGLGPTKDDITKPALGELTGSTAMVEDGVQLEIIRRLLSSRGLDMLDINRAQASVPDTCKVIPNRLGTAPIMAFPVEGGKMLYALPGVPFEATGALPDVISDIRSRYDTGDITHRNIMVYGMAESALSKLIAPWEDALPDDMHLAYLPNLRTGVRLRLSMYSGSKEEENARIEAEMAKLKAILGDMVYADGDDTLESAVGRLLKKSGKTLSVAESCTGGEISHLITSVPGASSYYLGGVTSYAVSVKEKVLGVPAGTVEKYGVVSSEVAAAMAEGVRRITGSDFSVATTGLAGPGGDGVNPVGTVWIGAASASGTKTKKVVFGNDRTRNIERFAAAALNFLRLVIQQETNNC